MNAWVEKGLSQPLVEKSLSLPLAAQLLFFVNLGALLFALTMQYGFDVKPCDLCIWERIPYGSAAILAFPLMMQKTTRRQTIIILALIAAVFAAAAVLAFYHSGVERHWWAGAAGCTSDTPVIDGMSVDQIREMLLQRAGGTRCDVISWKILGLSMANLNVVASLFLSAFSALAARRESLKN